MTLGTWQPRNTVLLLLQCVSVFLFVVGFGTNYWLNDIYLYASYNSGLWRHCFYNGLLSISICDSVEVELLTNEGKRIFNNFSSDSCKYMYIESVMENRNQLSLKILNII